MAAGHDDGADALTADGRVVRIRTVRPDDAAALAELHEQSSPRSRYLRFFSGGVTAHDSEVRRLTRPAGADHAAVLAEEAGTVVGVASYERLDAHRAEFAVLVADACQGNGIGTLLLEHLAARARRAGIAELVGDVLPVNSAMLRVARDLSPAAPVRAVEDGALRVRVPARPDEAALAATDARDRAAERLSLRPLLAPASVAVVGAGRRPGGVGHEVLTGLVAGGFTGRVYPVNPHAGTVAGLPAYPAVTAVPGPVDLAVIAVPAGRVEGVVADCAKAGVSAAVVLTAGFGETGDGGRAGQARLVRLARAHGLRLVGPNCLGVLNTDPAVRLDATFAAATPPPGGLAVATQSGAVGIAVLDHARRTGAGVSSFVSLGNKADVSGNDLLSYWYADPATKAVALYLESFGNPRRFARVARAVARRKPVLAVKSGRSAGGQRAGASHTAAAAAPDTAVDALFAQAGVVRTDNLGELLDAARILLDQPLPAGGRIGLVGNAGGVNVLAADAAEAAGLSVPELSTATRARLAAATGGTASGENPVDLGAGASPAALRAAVHALAVSGDVDTVIGVFAATRTNDVPGALAALADAADAAPDLPMAAILVGVPDPPTALGARRVPVYALPEDAVRAVGRAAAYAAWRRQPLGARPELAGVDADLARATVTEVLAHPGWQPSAVVATLLGCYGIPMVPTEVVTGAEDAVTAAGRAGYPVAVKSADPAVVHKSDLGAVRLNLPDADAVREAYAAIGTALGQPAPAVTVQPMVAGDVELVAGVVHDPLFGSLVMLGLGGVRTDILGDRAFRLLPLTDLDAGVKGGWGPARGAGERAGAGRRGRGPKVLPGAVAVAPPQDRAGHTLGA